MHHQCTRDACTMPQTMPNDSGYTTLGLKSRVYSPCLNHYSCDPVRSQMCTELSWQVRAKLWSDLMLSLCVIPSGIGQDLDYKLLNHLWNGPLCVCKQWIWHRCSLLWWRHQMETFSTLLTLCEGNSSQRPVTQNCDVFFDLHLNKHRSKHARFWWLEMPSRSLWRHCNTGGILVRGRRRHVIGMEAECRRTL